jgi:type I restriction-modification system DNA methylase subunit
MVFCDLSVDKVLCDEFGYILDPCCGVGSFLAAFIEKVYSSSLIKEGASQIIKKFINNKIIGIDKSERMIKLAMINLSMFGCHDTKLFLVNALDVNSLNLDGNVSVILTNPPFGAEFPSNELDDFKIVHSWSETKPKKVNSEILFLEKYIDWLKPGGLLVCIVPDSILNNKGIYENLRRGISKNVTIRAVISLPQNTFATTGTETKTSLLYLSKEPYTGHEKTYMAICNNNGYDVATVGTHRTKKYNDSSDLHRILNDYKTGKEEHGQWVGELNDCHRWDATYHVSLPSKIKQRIAESTLMRVKDVAELTNERFNPKRLEANKTFNYIEISDVDAISMRAHGKAVLCSEAPSRARKLVREQDVIFSTVRPERGIVAVISDVQDRFVCTTGFAVLRTKRIAPMALSYLLQSDFVIAQIKKYSVGISYPAIDEKDLLEIILPISDDNFETYDDIAKQIENMERQISDLRGMFKNEIDKKLVNV